jgi:hypothetical protein
MDNTFIIGLLSWVFPGAGHLIQKRWKRGILVAAVFWAMFIIAIMSGGAHYPGFTFNDGALLYLLNILCRFGSGLGLLISYVWAINAPENVAAWATFEYGGRFLEVAGLLNFLAVMDAVDIHLGRKK